MFVILGATGHIGSALVTNLVAQGIEVFAVTHTAEKREQFEQKGVRAVVVDVHDVDALRAVFRQGIRAFLLNPPASPSTDTDAEEHRTLHAIVEALRGTSLEKVVLESAYGAQKGDRLGDLSVLFDFEQALRAQDIPTSVLRAAYYMSNWDQMLEPARQGKLPTMLPADHRIPMVATDDIARVAAELLTDAPEGHSVSFVEGPEQYTPSDVASAFAFALQQPVEVSEIPREDWIQTYREWGFSVEAAEAYCRMTAATVDETFVPAQPPRRGTTSLRQYIAELVQRRGGRSLP